MWLPSLWTATQKLFDPLARDGVTTVHSAEEGSSNSRIGVGVPAAHDGIRHPIFQIRGVEKLPQRISESGQNPALLVDVVVGRGRRRTND